MKLSVTGKRVASIISCCCFLVGMVKSIPRRGGNRGGSVEGRKGGGGSTDDIFDRGQPGPGPQTSLSRTPSSLGGYEEIDTDTPISFSSSSYFVEGEPNNIGDNDVVDDSDGDLKRIVGGQQADIMEYPYFVQTNLGGCGAVLIASEWVLTAAHCGNIQGQQLNIGAYRNFVLANGSQVRICARYIRDPGFLCSIDQKCDIMDPRAPFQNDLALCKLDEPVYVNDINVKLQINEESSFPNPGSDVQAIGFGRLVTDGFPSVFLQEVTLQTLSNDQCKSKPNAIYNLGINPTSICAFADGKDSCQGDSGGPLIVRVFDPDNPLKSVHTHVGITSWGYFGCGMSDFPGVYSRTSAGKDFIRRTICDDFDSPSPFCKPTVTCNKKDKEQKVTIKIVTDFFANETSWELLDVTNDDEVLLATELKSLEKNFFTYEDSICLSPGTYEFIIRDAFGDGMVVNNVDFFRYFEGFYSVLLDDVEIETSRGNDFEYNRTFTFTIDGTTHNIVPTGPEVVSPTASPTDTPRTTPTKSCEETIESSGLLESTSLKECIWIAAEEEEVDCPRMCKVCPQAETPAPTPISCQDDPDYTFNMKSEYCQLVASQSNKKRKRLCKKRDVSKNTKVRQICRKTCGECL